MKINARIEKKLLFRDIVVGECFSTHGGSKLYMKIPACSFEDSEMNCVRLVNGYLDSCSDEVEVAREDVSVSFD